MERARHPFVHGVHPPRGAEGLIEIAEHHAKHAVEGATKAPERITQRPRVLVDGVGNERDGPAGAGRPCQPPRNSALSRPISQARLSGP